MDEDRENGPGRSETDMGCLVVVIILAIPVLLVGLGAGRCGL